MNHRTYGETKDCKGCRYWSEMLAQVIGGGRLKAMCLSETGPQSTRYVTSGHSCPAWESGHLGAIDEPGDDPLKYENEGTLS